MTRMIQNYRQYGDKPSSVVVLHGGPGGAGEVEPLARELGRRGHSVLEPFQTQTSVQGQLSELQSQVELYCTPPVTIIGWSWGAWLGCLFAAQNPTLTQTLVLVGSGPFEARYTSEITNTRICRLTDKERDELASLRPESGDPAQVARFLELSDITDTFQRDDTPMPDVEFDEAIHTAVWQEASAMRADGSLLDAFRKVRCRVVAIHGDYDPHPAEGVSEPLAAALPSATFKLLERCGHKPWQEVYAKEDFYQHVEQVIA